VLDIAPLDGLIYLVERPPEQFRGVVKRDGLAIV
jgi:hypothetical protein